MLLSELSITDVGAKVVNFYEIKKFKQRVQCFSLYEKKLMYEPMDVF